MTDFNDEINLAAKAIRDRINKDLFGNAPRTYPFVERSAMHPSTYRPSFKPIILGIRIITNDYITQKKRRSRKRPESFWAKQWRLLWDHNPWAYSLIEYYEIDEPTMIFDRANNTIICHPAIEQEIKTHFTHR